jgi:hypothetical protein
MRIPTELCNPLFDFPQAQLEEAERVAKGQAVHDAWETIIEKGGNMIFENYIQRKVVPYTFDRSRKEVSCTLSTLFLNRDKGEIPQEASSSNSLLTYSTEWNIEEEPHCVPIDVLATGSVRIKKKPVVDAYPTLTDSRGTDTASVGGFSQRSKGSKAQSRALTSRSSNRSKGTKKGEKDEFEETEEKSKKPIIVERPVTPKMDSQDVSLLIIFTQNARTI